MVVVSDVWLQSPIRNKGFESPVAFRKTFSVGLFKMASPKDSHLTQDLTPIPKQFRAD
jgi:hypothetical protein